MLPGQDAKILEGQSLDNVSFLVTLLFHGEPRSNLQFQGLPLKLSTGIIHVDCNGSSILLEI